MVQHAARSSTGTYVLLTALYLTLTATATQQAQNPLYFDHSANAPVPIDSGSFPDSLRSGLPVANSTHSFWINSPGANPLADAGSTGELTSEADVCIIGAGISGVSTAYHLSQAQETKHLKTVILEARDFCSGATGRNGGHLTPQLFESFKKREVRFGTLQAKKSVDIEVHTSTEVRKIIAEHGLADYVDLVAGGHIVYFDTEESRVRLTGDFEAAKAAGVDFNGTRYIEADEMSKTYGTPHPAIFYPAHNLWPLKLVTSLFRIANSSMPNLTLHTRTPVTSIDSASSTLTTPRGIVSCGYIVHATNGYSSALLHPRYTELVVPARGQIIATRAKVPLDILGQASWSNGGEQYWFPRPVESPDEHPLVIVGGARSADEALEWGNFDDSVTNPKVGSALRGFLPGLLPHAFERGQEPEMEWTGILGFTHMGDPVVGPLPDTTNQYISIGFSGHGMPRTFACAEAVASMLAAKVSGEEWVTPDWLPNRYLSWNRL